MSGVNPWQKDKKHAKMLARRKRLAEEHQRKARFEKTKRLPEFIFEANEAPNEFVETIRAALQGVDLEDHRFFDKFEIDAYRRLKQAGANKAMPELKAAERAAGKPYTFLFMNNLGNLVFQRIPERALLNFIPFHDVMFIPRDHHILVRFRSLRQHSGPNGTCYYSRWEPKVVVEGKEYIVAFSRHAIEDRCLRVISSWPDYSALGDVFAFFAQCLEYEVCTIYPNQIAFSFFEDCHDHGNNVVSWSYVLATKILGSAFSKTAKYSYRVGYCPAVSDNEFLVAKTLYVPGFAGTPEYGRILASKLPWKQKQAMCEKAKTLDAKKLLEPEGEELLKWFHDQGVPQIRPRPVRYAKETD